MNSELNIFKLLKRLWGNFEVYRRKQFLLLLVLMLIASFAEILSIGAVLPFLGALSSPEKVFEQPVIQPIILFFNIKSPQEIILPMTLIFCFAVIFSAGIRLLLLWVSIKLSHAVGTDLSINIYRRTLYQPYVVHCSRNNSEIINSIYSKTKNVISVINMTLSLLSSSLILASILFVLLLANPIILIFLLATFGVIYFYIIRFTRKKVLHNGEIVAKESTQVIKTLQEGLGGIRDVLIDSSQEVFCKIYSEADLLLRNAVGSNSFISACPKYIMESLGVIAISVVALFLTQDEINVSNSIPILGLLALSAQRLLPVMQQLYASWTQISGSRASLRDVLSLLDQQLPPFVKNTPNLLRFEDSIRLENVCFSYNSKKPYILDKINLVISKGSRIGIVGTTGSGKSTLLDILMGLLQPSEGNLMIDNKIISSENYNEWLKHVAHVPQNIFLADTTVEKNIAFGVPENEIDHDRVVLAAKNARIFETIEALPEKFKTRVGERGIMLSGGQRQRIGIARALYKRAGVIVLDEATSALDAKTEESVMEAVRQLDKALTVIIVAHRLSTLKDCTEIIEIDNGKLEKITIL